MGGDHRTKNERTHVRQSNNWGMCLGSSTRCSCVSIYIHTHYIYFPKPDKLFLDNIHTVYTTS